MRQDVLVLVYVRQGVLVLVYESRGLCTHPQLHWWNCVQSLSSGENVPIVHGVGSCGAARALPSNRTVTTHTHTHTHARARTSIKTSVNRSANQNVAVK